MGQSIIARRGGGDGDSSAFEVKGYFTEDSSQTYKLVMVLYFKRLAASAAAEICANVAVRGDTSSLTVWLGVVSGNNASGGTFYVSNKGEASYGRLTGMSVSYSNGYCYLRIPFLPDSSYTSKIVSAYGHKIL